MLEKTKIADRDETEVFPLRKSSVGRAKSAAFPNDSILVNQCKEGLPYDTRAYTLLVQKYQNVVFRTSRLLLSNEADAEDATQEIFLRVFHHISKFQENASFKTWLYRIVRNTCHTKRVKRNLFDEHHLFVGDESGFPSARSETVNDRLDRAFADLSETDREAVSLRYVVEASFEEIAETLDVTLSAAKMRVYRATERLKTNLSKP